MLFADLPIMPQFVIVLRIFPVEIPSHFVKDWTLLFHPHNASRIVSNNNVILFALFYIEATIQLTNHQSNLI